MADKLATSTPILGRSAITDPFESLADNTYDHLQPLLPFCSGDKRRREQKLDEIMNPDRALGSLQRAAHQTHTLAFLDRFEQVY